MPTLLYPLIRLTTRLFGRRVSIRYTMDARIAHYTTPLIERLIANTPDGETFRSSLVGWRDSERPLIRIYRAAVSTFRLEGPMQEAGDDLLPLGGLLLSPGVTAHLNPKEADELDELIRASIEQTILQWIDRHGLQDLPPVSPEVDRAKADPEARALIAEWVAHRQEQKPCMPGLPDPVAGSDGGRNRD